jgi:hypothetical protein
MGLFEELREPAVIGLVSFFLCAGVSIASGILWAECKIVHVVPLLCGPVLEAIWQLCDLAQTGNTLKVSTALSILFYGIARSAEWPESSRRQQPTGD